MMAQAQESHALWEPPLFSATLLVEAGVAVVVAVARARCSQDPLQASL